MEILANSNTTLSLQQQHVNQLCWQKEIYLYQCVIHIGGAVTDNMIKDALAGMMEDHALLRSVYFTEPLTGQEAMMVQEDLAPDFRCLDHTAANGAGHALLQDEFLAAERKALHEKQGLLRATLIRTGKQTHKLLLSLSALAADAATIKLIYKELFDRLAGNAPDNATAPIQYNDYVEWQRSLLIGQDEQASLFWEQYKYQDLLQHRFPFEAPEPLQHQPYHRYGVLYARTDRHYHEDDIFQAFSLLLARHWQSDHIVVGRSFPARDVDELAGAVGPFSKVLPLMLQVDWNATCAKQLEDIRGTWDEVTAYHDSFVWQDGLSIKPDFPAVFEYLDAPQPLSKGELFMELETLFSLPDSCKLRLCCIAAGEGVQLQWYYDRSALDEFYVGLLDGQLQECLRQLHDARLLKDIDMLGGTERRMILEQFNHAAEAPGRGNVVALFEEQAALSPSAAAVCCEDRTLTYAELNKRSGAIAAYLATACNAQPGSVVGILMQRSEHCIAVMLGVLKAGCTFLPLAADWPAERVQYALDNAGAKVLVYDMHLLNATVDANIILLPSEILLPEIGESDNAYSAAVTAAHGAYIIYTSGSTGRPKGVHILHGSFLNYVKWANKYYFNNQGGYAFACFTPFTFDLTITSIFTTLLRGDAIHVLGEGPEMNQLLQQAFDPAGRIQAVKITPSQVTLLRHTGLTATRVNTVILGGEALTPEQVAYLHSLNPSMRVFNEYGPTEATVGCTVKEVTNNITIGKPIANARIYIVDDQNRLLPVGIPGQLAIGGSVLASGYINNEALTAERFISDPFTGAGRMYLTGDIARWLPNGELAYMGRSDTQVKLRGYRIELSEVEQVVMRFGSITNAVAALSEDGATSQRLICFYSADTFPGEQALIGFVEKYLPQYMMPSQWVYITRWPLSVNGKIDKKQLLEYAHTASQLAYAEPATPGERVLLEIWKTVLVKKDIGVRHNFFNIGGNSLNAIQVMTEVHKHFNVEISLQDIFTNNTVEKLAALISGAVAGARYEAIPVIEPRPYYEVSRSQMRMWILQQADPRSIAYNIPYAIEIKGKLHAGYWAQSLRQLVERHEILRTSFFESNGDVWQVVHDAATLDFRMAFTDLRGHAEQEKLVAEAVNHDSLLAFDLGSAPLLRAQLLQCSDDRHVFLMSMHHIVSDGSSIKNMMNELIEMYSALLSGRPAVLPVLPIQYKDFTAWQNAQLRSESYEAHRTFWTTLLDDAPRLELPADYPRPAAKTYNGAMEGCKLPADLADAFHAMAKEQGVTPFMAFLAILNILLARYSGQTDIVTGTPVAGRLHADLNNQLGYYVNTVCIRSRFDVSATFTELLQQVRTNMFDALSHQLYPFDDLVADLNIATDLSRSPLFDVMVEYENSDEMNDIIGSLPGIAFELLQSDVLTSKFDLSFHMNEDADGIFLSIEYNKDIFSHERMRRMLRHFEVLVRNVVADTSRPLTAYELIDEEEQQQLLYDNNQTARDFAAGDFLQRFESMAAQHPAGMALQCGSATYTYEELNGRANQFAHYLMRRYNIEANDMVAVLMERSEDMVAAILGILKTGAAYLPIDPGIPSERLKVIVRNAGPTLILTNFEQTVHFPNVLKLERVLSELDKYPHHNPGVQRDDDDLAYMIYTSGTTGIPKGVMIPWKALCNYVNAFTDYFGVTPADKVIQGASIAFDISIDELFPVLAAGGTLVVSAEGIHDVEAFINEIREHRVTIVSTTPHVVDIINKSIAPGTSLRAVISGGDVLEPRYISSLVHLPLKVYNTYGPTEATVCATYYEVQPQDLQQPLVPVGKPVANVQVYVLDEQLRPVPIGLPGELYIGGAGVAKGYWEEEELTAQRFISTPHLPGTVYKTGDLARWNFDGQLELIGRNDGQVKIRGYRIELREVEQVMVRNPEVADAKAIVYEHNDSRYLAAYVIPDGELNMADFRAYMKNYLPAYMVPDYIVPIKEFPFTANGKLDMRRLPDPMAEGSGVEKNFMAPQNEVQEKLVSIWQRILAQPSVSINDNFFFLGGHSLKAVLLVKAIYEEMGHKLLLRDIFNYPTVRELSTLFESSTDSRLLLNLNDVKAAPVNLFMIPPIIGSSTLFKDLAHALQGVVNAYGIQYKGFDEDVEFDESIDAMADTFIREIGGVQQEGPYTLLGYSMGGVVAYEMARKLEKSGKGKVDVIIVDSCPEWQEHKAQLLPAHDETAMRMELDEWLSMLNMEEMNRLRQLYQHNHRLLYEHITKDVIKGDIMVFWGEDEHAAARARAWEYHTLGDFEAAELKGNHFNLLALNRDAIAGRITGFIANKH